MNLDDKLAEIHEIPFPAVILDLFPAIFEIIPYYFHRSQFVQICSLRDLCYPIYIRIRVRIIIVKWITKGTTKFTRNK
jgi:hypothetical protein